jgi:urease accessory protein
MIPLLAHAEHGGGSGLLDGLAHPVSGLDHLVAMVAVGLWGAQLGAPALWLLPVAFPLVMALGGAAGLLGIGLPGVEIGIALSGVLLGLAVCLRWRASLPVALGVVAVLALFHGHAHGTELPEGASGLAYSAGFVVATGCLHACGIALGTMDRAPRGRAAVRVLGAGVAGLGAWFLWNALA